MAGVTHFTTLLLCVAFVIRSSGGGGGSGTNIEGSPSSATNQGKVAEMESANARIKSLKMTSSALADLSESESLLKQYASINYKAFYKFLKKFQKRTKLQTFASYIVQVLEPCMGRLNA